MFDIDFSSVRTDECGTCDHCVFLRDGEADLADGWECDCPTGMCDFAQAPDEDYARGGHR